MTASPQDLARALDQCMLADRPKLKRRLCEAERTPSRDLPRRVAKLEAEIKASSARYARRKALAPPVTYAGELPVVGHKDVIAAALRTHQVVIVCGETGSGKSTQLPKLCLELGRGLAGLIGHTQPRRIAARSIAARIAQELGSPLGEAVGYKVRFSDQVGEDAYIKLMTDGVLLSEIQHDRWLRQYDTLIIDEAHERSLNIDFLLGYLKTIVPRRPELKVIIASATIEPQRLSRFFDDAPVIEVAGRAYPVEVRYRPLATGADEEADRGQQQAILDAVDEIRNVGPGDILVFLPGEREIHETARALSKHTGDAEILPLYARLSAAEQNRIFQPHGQRRVVLATNVAETSLTVPGVRYVIDTGTARISRYSVRSKIQRLRIERISQASARQRLGRCGRLGPGVCIRLYTQQDLEARPAFTDPELKRANLAGVILRMKHLGLGRMETFPFLDLPERRFIASGYRLLETLSAVDGEGDLTALGTKLARLPVDPRLGRMILAADSRSCLREVSIIVSALAGQDPRDRPIKNREAADEKHRAFTDPRSDFLFFVNLWEFIAAEAASPGQLRKLCRRHFLSFVRVCEWQNIHRQLCGIARDLGLGGNRGSTKAPASYAAIHQALLAGLVDQIGHQYQDKLFTGARGIRFSVFPGSSVHRRPPRWLVAGELAETSSLYARTVAKIQPQWLEQVAAHLVKREHFEPHWQPASARVMAYERVTLFGLVLTNRRRVDYGRIDPMHAREVFIREALVEGRYDMQAAFARHNRAQLDEIRAMEERARRRDILIDDATLYQRYAERIPTGICAGATFERWLQEDDHAQRLYLNRDQLMRHPGEAVSATTYPSSIAVGKTSLPLTYRFEPGHEADGVTLTTPLAMLNQLDPARCEWLVPGWLEEKIIALVKTLPKSVRRRLVPPPEFARAFMDTLPTREESLIAAVSAAAKRISGIDIPPQAWPVHVLAPHLKMRFQVMDGKNFVAQGRDLKELQARLGHAARAGFQSLSARGFERSGITAWEFGALPNVMKIARQGLELTGYPALVDEGDSVSLRLTDTAAQARVHTPRGIRRLYMLRLKEQHKHLRKNLPDILNLCLQYQAIGACESLKTDIIETAFDRAFLGDDPLPTDKELFESRVASGRERVAGVAEALCAELKLVLQRHHEVRQRLARDIRDHGHAAWIDIDSQLRHLVYDGFVQRTPARWLSNLPRYLQAVALRLDRLLKDPVRDRRLQREVDPFWRRFLARATEAHDPWLSDAALRSYRWMLEEYRVSLFAQQLGTAVKTSAKRLEACWDQVQRAG